MKKLFSLSLLIAALVLVSCGGDKNKEFTVKFDSQGGTAVAEQTVKSGEKLKKPTDPTKENLDFGGWYKEAEGTTLWKFPSDKVTSDMTLYAKWNEKPVVNMENASFLQQPEFFGTRNGVSNTFLVIASKEIEQTGSGTIVALSPQANAATELIPNRVWAFSESADFTFDAANSGAKNTLAALNCFVIVVENGQFTKRLKVADGTLKLTKGDGANVTIEASVKDEEDANYKITCQGEAKLVIGNQGYGKEKPEVTTQTKAFTFPVAVLKNPTALEGYSHIWPWLITVRPSEADQGSFLKIALCLAPDATAIPQTTFAIDATLGIKPRTEQAVNSVLCGANTLYQIGTGRDAQVWYPATGTLTTTATGYTLTGESYFGSTLDFTYTGSLDLKAAPTVGGAPARIITSDFSAGFRR